MRLTVENYRGIKTASLTIEGIALVAAPNASGKSAIAQAAGAVLTGQPVPIPGVQKMMAGMLVRMGASSGFAALESDEGSARVEWPRAVYKTKGAPIQISAIAAGLESLTGPEPLSREESKRRTELLTTLLNAEPTLDDVTKYLKREGITDSVAASIWETIERQGWEGAHAQAKETGSRLKGSWEAITGERYGTKKAEAFIPRDWEPELSGASEQQLQAALTDARDTLDGMIAVAAVDDAERARLESLAADHEVHEAAEVEAKAALQAALSEYEAAQAAQRALRNPHEDAPTHECPHCKGALVVAGGRILVPTPFTEDDVKNWEIASDAITNARARGVEARERLNAASAVARESKSAKEKLTALAAGNSTQDQVERARQAVQYAQSRLSAFACKTKADRIHNSITQNAVIVAALDATGIRQSTLASRVSDFAAEVVAPLSAAARWGRIEFSTDLGISYDGRPWQLLSESERYRVRVLLQVAVAVQDGSAALVIDAADILDKPGRNGLVSLLRYVALPAVVCMTIPTPSEVPDLRAAGLGESYWIHDGTLAPLATAQQE